MPWRRLLQPLAWPLYQVHSRLFRGVTLGVRGLVLNQAGEVLLVEHTYMRGWYLPGGGVERGETAEAAMTRELAEEGGVTPTGPLRLVLVDNDERRFRGDHVLLYRIEGWTPCPTRSAGEILRRGWFHPEALPEDATADTRRRIQAALAWPGAPGLSA